MNYFTEDEFKCNCGCGMDVKQELKDKANEAREKAGVPFVISSGARCPAWNRHERGAKNSKHMQGLAMDVRCTDSIARFKIVKALIEVGFTGLDIANTYIHGDIAHDPPMIFIYKKTK